MEGILLQWLQWQLQKIQLKDSCQNEDFILVLIICYPFCTRCSNVLIYSGSYSLMLSSHSSNRCFDAITCFVWYMGGPK